MVILVLVVLAWVLIAPPVLAVDDPTTIVMSSVTMYRNLAEAGDMLALFDFTITYTGVQPTDNITTNYLVSLVNGAGTKLGAVAPYTFPTFSPGYNREAAAIYFSADQVTNSSMVWGTATYYGVVEGNPMFSWSGSVHDSPQKPVFWSTASSAQEKQQAALSAAICSMAGILQAVWSTQLGVGNFMVQVTVNGPVLTLIGLNYFLGVLPNLMVVAPYCLSASMIYDNGKVVDYTVESGGTMTDDTGSILASPLTLVDGDNTVTVTGAGNFTIELNDQVGGTASTIVGSGASVTGGPITLIPWTNTITVAGTGDILVSLAALTPGGQATSANNGTPLDFGPISTLFGISSMWVTTFLWFLVTAVVLFLVAQYTNTKVIVLFFDAMLLVGALLGMVNMAVLIGFAVIAVVMTSMVWFMNKSGA